MHTHYTTLILESVKLMLQVLSLAFIFMDRLMYA